MDVQVRNVTDSLIEGITATLSTTSEYVTIAEASKSYGDIKGGYYKTAYDARDSNNSGSQNSSYNYSYYTYSELSSSYGWQFAVSENAPVGTEVPFTLTFTDSRGNTWTDSFAVTVVAVDVEIACKAHEISDAASYGTMNNGDGSVNSGEVVKVDVCVQNTGASLAQGITATLSTTSAYVTIADENASKSYGDIKGGYYKTLYGASEYAGSSYYADGYSSSGYDSATLSASYGWQFTVSENAPAGTEVPFTLTFTDSRGNTWTDAFAVTVVAVDVEIACKAHAITDAASSGTLNNGDGSVNSGEVIKVDVCVQNTGASLAQGITAVLSTTSEYVTMADEDASKSYGDIKGGYYKTLYGASSYAGTSSYAAGYQSSGYESAKLNASYGWQFTVSENAPAGTEVPFALTFTDSRGNTWTDGFAVTVQ